METIARYLSELFTRREVDTTDVDVRASKEHITDNDKGGNELPLSVLTVMSNDDLLTEILLRLPVISLILFKSVSKHWLSLIKDTTFMMRRSQYPNIDSPSGVFFSHPSDNYKYGFRRLDIRIPVRSSLFKNVFKIGSKEEAPSNAFVKQSCNGLLLCYVQPGHKYYVYNPTVKMLNMIPQPNKSNVKPAFACGMIMCFDPTKSPHYKVVYATSIGDDDDDVVSIQIQTYSSETRSWSAVSSDPFSRLCFSCFEYGIYWNDAIHWLAGVSALHYKIGMVNKTVVLTKIQLPVTLDEKMPWDCKLYESRGTLLLIGKDSTHFHQLNVYEMRNGHSEWSLKYFVNLDDIMMPISEEWRIKNDVSCIALGEREEDSFMVIGSVIGLDAKIIQYNFGLKTYHDLSEPKLLFLYGSFLFTASFAGV